MGAGEGGAQVMAKRLIHHYAITSRRGGPLGVVAPDDLAIVLRAVSDVPTLPAAALAYCGDMARERVLFTCHAQSDLAGMFGGPFLFVEQLRAAGSVLSVPFERLAELGLAPVQARPVFIFSAGRAGSTLLARLLEAAGLRCASEPDMLTQMACLTDEERLALPQGEDTVLASLCIASLGRVLGPGAFLKLRSQCNARPLMLLDAAPGCRVVFLLRRADTWALSRNRAFGEPPNHAAMLLRQAVDALDKLVHARVALEIVWFEDVVRNPIGALRICAPYARPDPDKVACVMGRDSQEGTSLARDTLRGAEASQDFCTAFRAAWDGARAGATWSGRTEELVAEMFRIVLF
jgi:hypothetical protein